ncbi:hypothetical protein FKM82_018452 [Ascaphus truei]
MFSKHVHFLPSFLVPSSPGFLPQNCSQLIQTIEDTGTILREIRDLEEQIEIKRLAKKTLSNLQKILEDYKAIRQETQLLRACPGGVGSAVSTPARGPHPRLTLPSVVTGPHMCTRSYTHALLQHAYT